MWTRALVPAIFSGVIYCTWSVFSYWYIECCAERDALIFAGSPFSGPLTSSPRRRGPRYCTRRYVTAFDSVFETNSSDRQLHAMQEESPTFASSLALALAVRPACDLLCASRICPLREFWLMMPILTGKPSGGTCVGVGNIASCKRPQIAAEKVKAESSGGSCCRRTTGWFRYGAGVKYCLQLFDRRSIL